jgi:hypothetical protein
MGIKESDTPPPSSVDGFLCGKTLMKKAMLKRYLVSEATWRYAS